MSSDTQETASVNHISTVRKHLLDTLADLRNKEAPMDIDRARAVSEVAQTIINSAKVEVEYLHKTGQTSTPFLEVPPDQQYITNANGQPALPNGIVGITRHVLK